MTRNKGVNSFSFMPALFPKCTELFGVSIEKSKKEKYNLKLAQLRNFCDIF